MSIQDLKNSSNPSEESSTLECCPSDDVTISVPPNECTLAPTNKLFNNKSEKLQIITELMASIKLKLGHLNLKPLALNLSSQSTNVFPWTFTEKDPNENCSSSDKVQAEISKAILNLMTSKNVELKCSISKFECSASKVEKVLSNAKQVSFKLEEEPESVPKKMGAAITQAQRLLYLLSISACILQKLEHYGLALSECVQELPIEAKKFHSIVDYLIDYVFQSIFEICSKIELH